MANKKIIQPKSKATVVKKIKKKLAVATKAKVKVKPPIVLASKKKSPAKQQKGSPGQQSTSKLKSTKPKIKLTFKSPSPPKTLPAPFSNVPIPTNEFRIIRKVIKAPVPVTVSPTKVSSESHATKLPAQPQPLPMSPKPKAKQPTQPSSSSTKVNTDKAFLDRLNSRLTETEKKLSIILSFIRNQYGEGHSIIQTVKASIGQNLDEELICNVGKVTPGSKTIRRPALPQPIFNFNPPEDYIEYPRHVWIPRDCIPKSEYNHAFVPGKTAKPKNNKTKKKEPESQDSSVMNKKCKVITAAEAKELALKTKSKAKEPSPKRPLRPLQLLEAEMGAETKKKKPSMYSAVYSDSDDELLHEPPEFETLGSLVEAAVAEDVDFYYNNSENSQEPEDGPQFQILSTTSLASGVPEANQEHYNCNDCNKRFVSVRQLAKHSLVHNSDSKFTKSAPATKSKVISNGNLKKHRPMPVSAARRAAPTPNHATVAKNISVSIAKKRTTVIADSGPVTCELCSKLCPNRNSYNYHKIIQHNAKKTIFICSTCRKCCPSSEALREHEALAHCKSKTLVSNGAGPGPRSRPAAVPIPKYQCPHCSKRFPTPGLRSKHVRTSHLPNLESYKEEVNKCADCGHTFKNGEALARHEESIHGKKKLTVASPVTAGEEKEEGQGQEPEEAIRTINVTVPDLEMDLELDLDI